MGLFLAITTMLGLTIYKNENRDFIVKNTRGELVGERTEAQMHNDIEF